MSRHLLRFRIAGVPLALCASDAASVHEDVQVIPLPGASAGFCGVATLCGQVMAVLDPAALLSPPAPPDAGRGIVLLLLAGEGEGVALRVPEGMSLSRGGAEAPVPERCLALCAQGDRDGDGEVWGVLSARLLVAALAAAAPAGAAD